MDTVNVLVLPESRACGFRSRGFKHVIVCCTWCHCSSLCVLFRRGIASFNPASLNPGTSWNSTPRTVKTPSPDDEAKLRFEHRVGRQAE